MPYKKLIFGILHISNLRPLFMLISTRTGLGYMHGVCQDGSFNIENEFFVRCLASQIFFVCLLQCFLLVWLYTKYCVLIRLYSMGKQKVAPYTLTCSNSTYTSPHKHSPPPYMFAQSVQPLFYNYRQVVGMLYYLYYNRHKKPIVKLYIFNRNSLVKPYYN